MKTIYNKLLAKQDLTENEVREIFDTILKGELSDVHLSAFLMGLRMKGETVSEIVGVVRALKDHALQLPIDCDDAMCNCGTGGDQSYSFNISTTACFILAAGGIRIAKAGNRSISSKSGSADVLEELGINISAEPDVLAKALKEVGLAFVFAQTMHPAMRFIGPVRRELGIPTIMNLVGPLANPLALETQLMGIYRGDLQKEVAQTMDRLGRRRALIITGPDNMDEAALYGINHYTLLDQGQISQGRFTYEDFGMKRVEQSDIKGGDAKENAKSYLVFSKQKQALTLKRPF